MNDLTVIYITANQIPEPFQRLVLYHLFAASKESPFIAVSKKPMEFDTNLISTTPISHISIYRDALLGVKAAETKYIAIAEDDILYSPDHFTKRPRHEGVFAYNIACWSIYTWSEPPIFSYTGRRNHGMLICERDLYIKAMEERFSKFTDDAQINHAVWAEPGKYESQLGVTPQQTEVFYTDPANVMFTHPKGLSMQTLGKRKRLAPIRAYEIPHWGRAEAVVKLYA